MGVLSAPEIRSIESNLSPTQRAKARDSYVREFERQFRDWSGIAKCCLEVQRDRDWEILGFHSFAAWILNAAPASSRYIFLAMELFTKLSPDIPEDELAEIPLGSAKVLTQVSPSVRRDPKARTAARQRPKELRKSLQKDFPEQHIEGHCKIAVLQGQFDLLEEGRDTYEALCGVTLSLGEFIEFLVSNWMDSPWEDSGYSNRQKAKQLVQ